jgi:hypothetical protein
MRAALPFSYGPQQRHRRVARQRRQFDKRPRRLPRRSSPHALKLAGVPRCTSAASLALATTGQLERPGAELAPHSGPSISYNQLNSLGGGLRAWGQPTKAAGLSLPAAPPGQRDPLRSRASFAVTQMKVCPAQGGWTEPKSSRHSARRAKRAVTSGAPFCRQLAHHRFSRFNRSAGDIVLYVLTAA